MSHPLPLSFLKGNKSHLRPKIDTWKKVGLFSQKLCLDHFSLSSQVVISTRPPWRTSWRAMRWFTEVWGRAAPFCVPSSTTPNGCEVSVPTCSAGRFLHFSHTAGALRGRWCVWFLRYVNITVIWASGSDSRLHFGSDSKSAESQDSRSSEENKSLLKSRISLFALFLFEAFRQRAARPQPALTAADYIRSNRLPRISEKDISGINLIGLSNLFTIQFFFLVSFSWQETEYLLWIVDKQHHLNLHFFPFSVIL